MGKNRTSFGRYASASTLSRSYSAGETVGHIFFFVLAGVILLFKAGVVVFLLWLLYRLVSHFVGA